MMKIGFKTISCLLLGLFLTLSSGCGAGADAGKADPAAEGSFCVVEDSSGRSVDLKKKPERIVVTSVSFLEPLHAVGGSVAGRPDSKTKMPDFAKDAAGIGKVYQIDAEKLLACEPDLVIINQGMNEKLLEILDNNGIPAIVTAMKSYEDVKQEIRTFSMITGEKEKGEALVQEMDGKIREIAERIPREKKRVAVIHSTSQGLSVQLEGSIAGNIVKLLGWENVAEGMTPMEKNPDAAPYSMETLVEQNPDIIFVTSMGKLEDIKAGMDQMIQENPAWQTIPAIEKHQLYYLPQDLFLLSPGIHYPEAVALMAGLIYPEAVK